MCSPGDDSVIVQTEDPNADKGSNKKCSRGAKSPTQTNYKSKHSRREKNHSWGGTKGRIDGDGKSHTRSRHGYGPGKGTVQESSPGSSRAGRINDPTVSVVGSSLFKGRRWWGAGVTGDEEMKYRWEHLGRSSRRLVPSGGEWRTRPWQMGCVVPKVVSPD